MILSPLDSKFSLTVDIFPLQCFFLLTSYENFQAHRKGEGVLQSAPGALWPQFNLLFTVLICIPCAVSDATELHLRGQPPAPFGYGG